MLFCVTGRNRTAVNMNTSFPLGLRCRVEFRRDFTERPDAASCTREGPGRRGGRSWQGCSRGSAEVNTLGRGRLAPRGVDQRDLEPPVSR